ncbi:NUDIX hydrolase [Paenibacillus sp. 598K]|uniref:NUDIX hydrolase n=1 Tax=Paenibacillus sp. 598K TaxID=1117987 RepID=UPI000FF92B8C|nr:NUDIX hydrolase [Paenibacillus sp. 598K]GBF73024.1 NUDIX hydrolase [Paenibacillus sp. 598K]
MTESLEAFHRHIGVYGICIADGCLLVIRKIKGPYAGKYDLPGGRLEPMETLEQGLQREIAEETGYRARACKPVGACDFTVRWTMADRTNEYLHHIAILYAFEVNRVDTVEAIRMFEEQDSEGALWLPLADAKSNHCSPLVMQAAEWLRTGTLPVSAVSVDYRG